VTAPVVVPNRDGAGLVGRCVEAALAAGADEVVVVDDGSTDASAAEAAAAGARVVPAQGRGFAAAVNTGVRETAGESVLVLNSDCFLEPDALRELGGALADDPSLGAVGAGLVEPDGEPSRSHGRLMTPLLAVRSDVMLKPPPPPNGTTGTEPVSFLPLACALVRRADWEAIGGLDESFPFYYEDQDFCLRLQRAGRRLAVRWDARAVHVGGGSSTRNDPQRWVPQFYASRAHYLRKHFGLRARLHGVLWSAIALLMSGSWLVRRSPEARRWARAYAKAATAGWKRA
jgi:GT2 family glycosyltransferase